MTLGIRKLIVLVAVGLVFAVGNLWILVSWLQDHGVIDWARYLRAEYLTGTAITIILVLLVLLARTGPDGTRWLRRCSVCDRVVAGSGRYCSDCGSKIP